MDFREYIYRQSGASYAQNILLIDEDGLEEAEQYSTTFSEHGFEVVRYEDDLRFRMKYEDKVKVGSGKLAVLAAPDDYIPYDIRKALSLYRVSYEKLFPRLNHAVLKRRMRSCTEREFLVTAYLESYSTLPTEEETEQFILERAFAGTNIRAYAEKKLSNLLRQAKDARTHSDWFRISKEKASIDIMATKHDFPLDTSELNHFFFTWALSEFGKQSTVIDSKSPVLVSRTMEYMHDRSNRFVLVVMDGMSEFDWKLLSDSFDDIVFHESSVMAMIPSVTSVSRQCLLGGKLPNQLLDPWHQAKEKTEFIECARGLGYKDTQIKYQKGYDAEFGLFTKCGAVIIMDIDENVHGQKQSRIGMYNDVSVMAKQGRLAELVKRLLAAGFDVYITADHGNTPCVGIGKMTRTGVETETKSHRMVVLKDFADKESIMEKFDLMEYPGYYLPKENDYLISRPGKSLDNRDDHVMNHGGITLDEVVVPFITIKAEDYHG